MIVVTASLCFFHNRDKIAFHICLKHPDYDGTDYKRLTSTVEESETVLNSNTGISSGLEGTTATHSEDTNLSVSPFIKRRQINRNGSFSVPASVVLQEQNAKERENIFTPIRDTLLVQNSRQKNVSETENITTNIGTSVGTATCMPVASFESDDVMILNTDQVTASEKEPMGLSEAATDLSKGTQERTDGGETVVMETCPEEPIDESSDEEYQSCPTVTSTDTDERTAEPTVSTPQSDSNREGSLTARAIKMFTNIFRK